MQASHAARLVDVAFDDPNLLTDAGLVPLLALAEQVGLPDLVVDRLTIEGAVNSAGANPAAKVMSLPAGSSGRTRSRTSTGCGTPATTWCSTRSVPPRRWAASCGRSPTDTCSS